MQAGEAVRLQINNRRNYCYTAVYGVYRRTENQKNMNVRDKERYERQVWRESHGRKRKSI